MSVFANENSKVRTTLAPTLAVQCGGYSLKMSGVDTTTMRTKGSAQATQVCVMANMVKDKALWDGSINPCEHDAMYQLYPSFMVDPPVASRCRIRPQPTFIRTAVGKNRAKPLQWFTIGGSGDERIWQRRAINLPARVVHWAPTARLMALGATIYRTCFHGSSVAVTGAVT